MALSTPLNLNRLTIVHIQFEHSSHPSSADWVLLICLKNRADVQKGTKAEEVIELLRAPPHAVLVSEPDIFRPEFFLLTEVLAKYTLGGGTTIFACGCGRFVRPDHFARFFTLGWGLPWEKGDYLADTFVVNTSMQINICAKIPTEASMTAVFVKGVAAEDMVYKTKEDSAKASNKNSDNDSDQDSDKTVGRDSDKTVGRDSDKALGRDPDNNSDKTLDKESDKESDGTLDWDYGVDPLIENLLAESSSRQAPVVFVQHSQGKVGWVGDVHNEPAMTPVILAMLGL